MAGYTRQSSAQILTGEVVRAAPLNAEFNQVQSAFNSSTGHTHSGATGEGPVIDRIGDTNQYNLVFVNDSLNEIEFFTDVTSAPVKQFSVADGVVKPAVTNDLDLGSSSNKFKDIYTAGTSYLDSVDINGGNIDGTTIGASSAAAITGTTITGTSFVTSGDMTFGDNDKAIFGAGNDLQIYHDGSNSYVGDFGAGVLGLVSDSQVSIQKEPYEPMATFVADGAATLFYDNAAKLATTSAGIDVTGGVGVKGSNFANTTYTGSSVNPTGVYTGLTSDSGFSLNVRDSGYLQFATSNTERMRIDALGFVGIGTTATNGNSRLNVTQGVTASSEGGVTPYFQFYNTNAGTDLKRWRIGGLNSGSLSIQSVDDAYSTSNVRMTIDNLGRVGIGTSSPSEPLEVSGKIKTTSGGVEFPDGTTQTTAAGAPGTVGSAVDGTATVPAFSFTSDSNTGLFRDGSGTVKVTSDGTEELTLLRASQAQAEAGTNNSVMMTPLRTAQAIQALSPNNAIPLAFVGFL